MEPQNFCLCDLNLLLKLKKYQVFTLSLNNTAHAFLGFVKMIQSNQLLSTEGRFFADSLKPKLSFYLNWRLGMFSSKLLNLVDAYRNSTSSHCNRLYRGRPLICYTIEKEINTIFLFWITACDKFLIRNCLTYLGVFF